MKTPLIILACFVFAFAFQLRAAEAIDPAQLQALEQSDPTPADEVHSGGVYYSATLVNQAGTAGLLPYPSSMNWPAWSLGDNVWLLDDLKTSASAHAGMAAMDDSDDPPVPGAGGDGSGSTNLYSAGYDYQFFTTNDLWLQILSVSNYTANLLIYLPWDETNSVYNLLYTTNLNAPIAWQWLLRTDPGQTNLLVPNATDAQGFYRLGPPNDLTANDSLGTNFWLAFPNMVQGSSGSNNLSLYISSPVAATGTVAVLAIETNGPVLTISGCGDTNVNGTYLLTNVPPVMESYGYEMAYINQSNTLVAGYYGNWEIVPYGSTPGPGVVLYHTPNGDSDLNRSDWVVDNDVGPPPVTTCPGTYFTLPFSVTPGQVTNVEIPPVTMITSDETVDNEGIHVNASQPVSVYAMNYSIAASAAFTGYPTPLLGTNYCVMAYNGYAGNSEFTIVATAAGFTTVTITPSATELLEYGSDAYTTNLQQGQTFEDHDNSGANDVTGTWITSDQPVAIFAGASDAWVPNNDDYPSGNPLMQEQLPVDDWGTQALALSFAGRLNGDTYRVLAVNDNTVVLTNGVVAGTNQAGQFLEMIIDGPVEFQASQPVQVAQFANGAYLDYNGNTEGDPCEILLPPTGHYLETNTLFSLPNDNINGDFDENYLNIIVPQSALTNTLVDGSPVALTNFVAICNSGYYGAQIPVTNIGAHTVTSSQPISVEAYGFGNAIGEEEDAYGYFGGVVK